ncbi:MAG: hypothetical protein QW456_07195 [Ignisphaera sp.]
MRLALYTLIAITVVLGGISAKLYRRATTHLPRLRICEKQLSISASISVGG